MKTKTVVARPYAWRWKGGYIMGWDSILSALKQQEIMEFKGVMVAARPFAGLVKAMAAGYNAMLSVVEFHENGDGKQPPFYGKGLKVEVGPEIQRGENGQRIRWRKSNGAKFYSMVTLADRAWLKPFQEIEAKVVRIEPKPLKRRS